MGIIESDLEKLETLRGFLVLTSVILVIASSVLIFSLLFVTIKIRSINQEKTEVIFKKL